MRLLSITDSVDVIFENYELTYFFVKNLEQFLPEISRQMEQNDVFLNSDHKGISSNIQEKFIGEYVKEIVQLFHENVKGLSEHCKEEIDLVQDDYKLNYIQLSEFLEDNPSDSEIEYVTEEKYILKRDLHKELDRIKKYYSTWFIWFEEEPNYEEPSIWMEIDTEDRNNKLQPEYKFDIESYPDHVKFYPKFIEGKVQKKDTKDLLGFLLKKIAANGHYPYVLFDDKKYIPHKEYASIIKNKYRSLR